MQLIAENTYRLSVNAKDILFESMWPTDTGVSMNSYIIRGEKLAVIDGVCGWDGVPESLFKMFEDMKIDFNALDYVIVNHTEPDHSGWLETLKKIRPKLTIYCSGKAKDLLAGFYGITEGVTVVKSGSKLDLGNGHVLEFVDIPNVHWPDTIATFDTKTGTLFPCDLFGGFGTVPVAPYDDVMSESEITDMEPDMLRYYANIIATFSSSVKKAIEKVSAFPLKIIAPGHGLIWRGNPNKVIQQYANYASYSTGPAKKAVTVIWSSMYGNTEKAVSSVLKGLKDGGVDVFVHNVPESHLSYILRDAWQSSGVVVAAPTYEYDMFPAMVAVVEELGKKKLQNRKAFHFGSYGWKSGTQESLNSLNENLKMKWEYLEPVTFVCEPSPEDMVAIEASGKELAQQVIKWVDSSKA